MTLRDDFYKNLDPALAETSQKKDSEIIRTVGQTASTLWEVVKGVLKALDWDYDPLSMTYYRHQQVFIATPTEVVNEKGEKLKTAYNLEPADAPLNSAINAWREMKGLKSLPPTQVSVEVLQQTAMVQPQEQALRSLEIMFLEGLKCEREWRLITAAWERVPIDVRCFNQIASGR